jgi:hypothetical protein
MTVSVWFKMPNLTSNSVACALDIPTSSGYKILGSVDAGGGVAGDPVRAYTYNGSGYGIADTSTGYSVDTWTHACGVFTSATLRAAFLDGGGKVTDTTNIVGAATELVLCRRRRLASIGSFPAGSYIAEVAVWSSALSDANVASLAAGINPKDIAGASLVAYWTLTQADTNTDTKGTNDLTESTTLTYSSDHPTILPASAGPTLAEATLSGEGGIIVVPKLTVCQPLTTLSGTGGLIVLPTVSNPLNVGNVFGLPAGVAVVPGQDSNQGTGDTWNQPKPQLIEAILSGDQNSEIRRPVDGDSWNGAGIVNGHEAPWFGAAHLIPRLIQDLGNVITDQVVPCEIYNADKMNSITVASVVNNLGSGIEVSGVPETPFDIESQDGLVFNIIVRRSGALTIDGSYTLILSTGEEYTLYFIGSRIVLFPIRPEAPLREHLIFDTKIIEAIDGSEQRIANRQYPRGMFEATYRAGQKKIEMLLFDRQSKIVAWPAWHEPAYLDGAHSVDDLTVTVNTTDYANFFVGGYAVVLHDENFYDALKIESMTSTTLTFESGLSYDYKTKVQVMPLLTAYIEASSASLKYSVNQQYFNLRIHVDPEVNDIADDSAWTQYEGKTFLDDPNMIKGGQLAESLRTKVFVIDNLTGLRNPVSAWDHNKRYSKKGWKTNTRQELWELRQLLHFLKGKQVSFYIPTFWKDIVVTDTMQIGTFVLNMDNIGYTVNARQRGPKQWIRIIFKDGSILVREIQNSAEVSETQEQLTLDAGWPAEYEPEEIERIEYLEKVRLDVDDIVLIHYNALGQSECTVPIKEVDE